MLRTLGRLIVNHFNIDKIIMISPNIGILVVLILLFLVISSSKISLNVGNKRVSITETLLEKETNPTKMVNVLNQYKYLLILMAIIGYLLFQISIEIGVLVLIVMLIKHKEISDGLNNLIDGTDGTRDKKIYENTTENEWHENEYDHQSRENMIGGMHPDENHYKLPSFIDQRFETNLSNDPSKYTGEREFEKPKRTIRPQYNDFESSTVTHHAYDPTFDDNKNDKNDKMEELFNDLENDNKSIPVQSHHEKFTQDLRSGNFEYSPHMDLDTEAKFNSMSPDPNPYNQLNRGGNINMSISKVESDPNLEQSGYDTDDDIDNIFHDLDDSL